MFRLTLPSNASMNFFPDNTLSNFTVKPLLAINASEYECALAEIMYPNRFHNVREGYNHIYINRTMRKRGVAVKEQIFTIQPGFYPSIKALIKAIWESGIKSIRKQDGDGGADSAFIFEQSNDHVTVIPRYQWTIRFGGDIAMLLGFVVMKTGPYYGTSDIIKKEIAGSYHASLTGGMNSM